MRRMALWFALPLALAAGWFLAGRLHRFAYWVGHKTPAQVAALATGGWQMVQLTVDGDAVYGLVRAPQRPEGRWVLFAPGNSSAMLDGFQQVLDELRGDADVGLALFAYRGFDASSGTPSPAALLSDLRAQWHYLRQRGIPAERIELWGYSLGTVLATQLAATLTADLERPAALRLIAGTTHIPVMKPGWFGRFLPPDDFDALAAAPQVRCPVTMLHGTADDALPVAMARQLAAAFVPPATLREIDGGGHFDLWSHMRPLLPR